MERLSCQLYLVQGIFFILPKSNWKSKLKIFKNTWNFRIFSIYLVAESRTCSRLHLLQTKKIKKCCSWSNSSNIWSFRKLWHWKNKSFSSCKLTHSFLLIFICPGIYGYVFNPDQLWLNIQIKQSVDFFSLPTPAQCYLVKPYFFLFTNCSLSLKFNLIKLQNEYRTCVSSPWATDNQISKVGCVFLMVIVSMLPHAKFGRNDHREYVIPNYPNWLSTQIL